MANRNNGNEQVGESTEGPSGEDVDPKELEQLSARVEEFVQEAALAFKRIAKNHEEIEQLKAETRAILESLRVA